MLKRMAVVGVVSTLLIAIATLANRAWAADGPVVPRPAATTVPPAPVEKDGLQVTVTSSKAIFAAGEALKFAVQFKNVSQKPFNLLNADHLEDWQIRFAKQGPGRPDWHVYGIDVAGQRKLTVTKVDPGQAVAVPLVVDDLKSVARILSGGKEEQVKPGKYLLAIELNQGANRENDPAPAVKYWAGQITTEPVEFEITDKPAKVEWGQEVNGLKAALVPLGGTSFAADEPLRLELHLCNVGQRAVSIDAAPPRGWRIKVAAKAAAKGDAAVWEAREMAPGYSNPVTIAQGLGTSWTLHNLRFMEWVDVGPVFITDGATRITRAYTGSDGRKEIPIRQHLPPGKYSVVAALAFNPPPPPPGPASKPAPAADAPPAVPANADTAVSWTGRIETAAVEIEIADRPAKAGATPAAEVKELIGVMEGNNGAKRAAATKAIFDLGEKALEPLRQAGAKQVSPFPFGGATRADMVFSLLEGLKPNQRGALAGYTEHEFGLQVEGGCTEEEVRKMGEKYGFAIVGTFNPDGHPSCYVKLKEGKKLEEVLRAVLSEEAKVRSASLNGFDK